MVMYIVQQGMEKATRIRDGLRGFSKEQLCSNSQCCYLTTVTVFHSLEIIRQSRNSSRVLHSCVWLFFIGPSRALSTGLPCTGLVCVCVCVRAWVCVRSSVFVCVAVSCALCL